MAGLWTGDEVMHPGPWSPETKQATGKLTARIGLGGLFVISDYEQSMDGAVTFSGHGVYGFDASTDTYSMYWFDSMSDGFIHPAKGQWSDDTLVFVSDNPESRGRYTYRWLDDDTYTFKMEHSSDGEQWQPMMDATFKRASADRAPAATP